MNEPKPFASLTSSLLARKGTARPAMRPQMFMATPPVQDDLGWNDMGEERAHDTRAFAAGLTPMQSVAAPSQPMTAPVLPESEEAESAATVPAIVEQQRELSEKIAAPKAKSKPVAEKPAAVTRERKAKAAFTLRLDADRHLRLRLACAVGNRSAQQIVTEALDQFLSNRPDIDALVERMPAK